MNSTEFWIECLHDGERDMNYWDRYDSQTFNTLPAARLHKIAVQEKHPRAPLRIRRRVVRTETRVITVT